MTGGEAIKKFVAFAIIVGIAVALYLRFGDAISLPMLARREAELREYQNSHPLLVYGAASAIYVAITGLSLPGATGLTLVYGWYFGLLRGFLLVSFASTMGATLAFLLSRYLFRDFVQRRFGDKVTGFVDSLKADGVFYLFTLRLVPVVPFFVINAVMGLTAIPARTFWWVSQVGMLPGTAVYVYAGSSAPSLQQLAENGVLAVFRPSQLTQILIALGLLGALPLVVRWSMKRWGSPYASLSNRGIEVTSPEAQKNSQ